MLQIFTETNKVSRWGHSLAIRIPAHLARRASLSEGCLVALSIEDSKLVIASVEPEAPRYDLAQLIAGITEENIHEEIDFGDPVGGELI